MKPIENREAWFFASKEFEENRHPELWRRCLSECGDDENLARARYLQEAAALYDGFLAEGRRDGSPHADGQGGVQWVRDPNAGKSAKLSLYRESALLALAVPAMVIAAWVNYLYFIAQDRFPFQVWAVLLAVLLIPAAGILVYAGSFALRYRLSESFRQARTQRLMDALALRGIIAAVVVGMIGMYLIWAF